MIRSVFALVVGYISINLFDAFIRFIISVYSKSELVLSGIAQLPNTLLAYAITTAGFLFGLIGGFLTCSIADGKPKIEILSLIILIVASGLFTYYFTGNNEPVWYLIIAPLLKIAGVYLAYMLFVKQNTSLKNSSG